MPVHENTRITTRRALCAALCVGCAYAGQVRAEPVVRVRADSRIELGVTHLDVGMAVTGALRDELGHGLSERSLALTAIPVDDPDAPFEMAVRTNGAGEFSLEIADGNHDYRLLASFDGDAGHRGVRVERSVERARSDVRLELRVVAGSRLDLDAADVVLHAVAESDAGGQGIALRLSDETGRELALTRTDAHGHAQFVVPTDRFGPPGTGLLRVESLRDERHAEAQTEARIIRSRLVTIDLRLERERVEVGSELGVEGSVQSRGGPSVGVPVGLYIGRDHVRTVMSDGEGHFGATLSADGAPTHSQVSARVEADPSGAHPAAERSVPLDVVAPEPLPWTWLIGILASGVAAAWLVAGRRRRSTGGALQATAPRPGNSLGSAREGPLCFSLSGSVLGDQPDLPIAAARVEITPSAPGVAVLLSTDPSGAFVSPAFPPGPVRVRASARGFASSSVELVLPHNGEGEHMTLRLGSLRARAVRAFRAAVEHSLPFPRAFAVWTTREVRAFLAQRKPEQRVLLGELALEVERAAYSPEPPTEEELRDIEQHASALGAAEAEPVRAEGEESATRSKNGGSQSPSAR
jgi:hypothetical protein